MDDILRKLGFYEEEEMEEPMSDEEAIRLIQIHERARQGRLRSQFMREIRLLKEKGEPPSQKSFLLSSQFKQFRFRQHFSLVTAGKPEVLTDLQSSSNLSAALSIQKTWRGYIARRYRIYRYKL